MQIMSYQSEFLKLFLPDADNWHSRSNSFRRKPNWDQISRYHWRNIA